MMKSVSDVRIQYPSENGSCKSFYINPARLVAPINQRMKIDWTWMMVVGLGVSLNVLANVGSLIG